MRRPVELCFIALAATSGIVLFGGGAPAGMSPLSVLEARTVIGGGPSSGCAQGEALATEDPPGTGCDSTCLRVPNVFSKGEDGNQVSTLMDCANRCGRFSIATSPCGS